MNMNGHHEDLTRHEEMGPGSERNFGLTFAAMFVSIALWALLGGRRASWPWLVAAGVMVSIVAAFPQWLAVPNWLWYRTGLILAAVVSPIALAIVYFGIIVPIGLLLRIAGLDPLRSRHDSSARSYWINRDPLGLNTNTFDNQF